MTFIALELGNCACALDSRMEIFWSEITGMMKAIFAFCRKHSTTSSHTELGQRAVYRYLEGECLRCGRERETARKEQKRENTKEREITLCLVDEKPSLLLNQGG